MPGQSGTVDQEERTAVLNAIWYIEGIYSTLRVQHNNGTGIRREGKQGKKDMKPDEFPREKNKSPSTALRHPLRTPSSLPRNATKQEEKEKNAKSHALFRGK